MLQSFEAGWLPLGLAFFAPDTRGTGLKIWKAVSCRPPHRAVRKGAAVATPFKHNLTRPVSEKHRVWQAQHRRSFKTHRCLSEPGSACAQNLLLLLQLKSLQPPASTPKLRACAERARRVESERMFPKICMQQHFSRSNFSPFQGSLPSGSLCFRSKNPFSGTPQTWKSNVRGRFRMPVTSSSEIQACASLCKRMLAGVKNDALRGMCSQRHGKKAALSCCHCQLVITSCTESRLCAE